MCIIIRRGPKPLFGLSSSEGPEARGESLGAAVVMLQCGRLHRPPESTQGAPDRSPMRRHSRGRKYSSDHEPFQSIAPSISCTRRTEWLKYAYAQGQEYALSFHRCRGSAYWRCRTLYLSGPLPFTSWLIIIQQRGIQCKEFQWHRSVPPRSRSLLFRKNFPFQARHEEDVWRDRHFGFIPQSGI